MPWGGPPDAQPFKTTLTPLSYFELMASELGCLLLANVLRCLIIGQRHSIERQKCKIASILYFFPKIHISVTLNTYFRNIVHCAPSCSCTPASMPTMNLNNSSSE